MRKLPVISSERVPSRFLIPFVLEVAVIAGFGAEFLVSELETFGVILASALLAVAVSDAWLVSKPNLPAPVAGDPPVALWSPEFRQFSNGDPWSAYDFNMQNRGAISSQEELDFHEVSHIKAVGANQVGYRGEQYLRGPGSMVLRRWTPNALTYDVDTQQANVLVINENYDPNWRLTSGNGRLLSVNGLLGVDLPSGKQQLTLVYRNTLFWLGSALTFLTSIVGALLWPVKIAKRLRR